MTALSLAFMTVPDLGPVEAVRLAAETGFDCVGLRLLPATAAEPPTYPLLDDPALLREVKAAIRDTGVSPGELEIASLKPELKADAYAGFLDRIADIGARHFVVVGDDPELGRLTENFARLCELAAPLGLIANLEPMPWRNVRDLAQARHVLESAGQANSALLIDALHFYRTGSRPEDLDGIDPAWLQVVQICDGPLLFDPTVEAMRDFARTARRFPGEGDLDLAGLLARFPADVIVSVEVPNKLLLKTESPATRARRAFDSSITLTKFADRHLEEMKT